MGSILLQLGNDLPPFRPPDAVGYRQVLAFLGAQVIRLMSVPGEQHGLSPVEGVHHPAYHIGHNVKGLLRPQDA